MADSAGASYDEYVWNHKSGLAKLGRLTSASLSFSLSFKSKDKKQADPAGKEPPLPEAGKAAFNPFPVPEYAVLSMPWNLNASYSLSYSHSNPFTKATVSQSVSLNGSLKLTEKWSSTMTTNFDIDAGKFSYTTFNISRNLHCFNMSFNLVPFGTRKSYGFTISATSSMLNSLKIDKKRSWYDNQ